MKSDINYLDNIAPDQEETALRELCAYLVAKGKYKNEDAARKDAAERVAFLEKADVYADDPTMVSASHELKSIHALIAGHHMHDLLSANEGFLPDSEKSVPSASATAAAHASTVKTATVGLGTASAGSGDASVDASAARAAPPASGAPTSVSRTKDARSLTDVFGTIDFDIRAGLSREQILTKLQDNGLAEDNAVEAYSFVRKQRRKKQQTRFVAALTIIVLTAILYFMAR